MALTYNPNLYWRSRVKGYPTPAEPYRAYGAYGAYGDTVLPEMDFTDSGGESHDAGAEAGTSHDAGAEAGSSHDEGSIGPSHDPGMPDSGAVADHGGSGGNGGAPPPDVTSTGDTLDKALSTLDKYGATAGKVVTYAGKTYEKVEDKWVEVKPYFSGGAGVGIDVQGCLKSVNDNCRGDRTCINEGTADCLGAHANAIAGVAYYVPQGSRFTPQGPNASGPNQYPSSAAVPKRIPAGAARFRNPFAGAADRARAAALQRAGVRPASEGGGGGGSSTTLLLLALAAKKWLLK